MSSDSSNADILLKNPVSFLDNSNPAGDIAISSRIRLARNISGHAFPSTASEEDSAKVCEEISAAAGETAVFAHRGALSFTSSEMSKLDRKILLERRLASKEFFTKIPGRRLLVCPQEACSLMINEEDQIRLQVIRPGMQLHQVWKEIDQLDDELGKHLNFAFDNQLGYLTSCPTNVGTGMRASVMLHLPALVLSGQIDQTVNGISKLNMAVRGIFGEGSEHLGALFQISNQSTLGESETHIIDQLEQLIKQLINCEKHARRELMEKKQNFLLDHIGRAYGLLKYSYVLSEKEALNALSGLRLGVYLELFKNLDIRKVNELLIELSPAHLRKKAGIELNDRECDEFRASYCREKLRQTS
ncbi:MAG: protein arginine kinase [Lentisphaeria bacterium]|nr:protein arginine kinase [Lentisphaeria bacterium]